MKTIRLLAGALALAFAVTQPVHAASEWPLVPADLVDVNMIKIDDGHALDYANHLAGDWRKSQDYAKSQGWITNYQVWINQYPRENEADVYLVIWYPKMPTPAESEKRDEAYHAFMKQTAVEMQAGSGKRAEYRHMAGSMLLQNFTWTK